MRLAQRILALAAAAVTLVLVLAQTLTRPNYPRTIADHVGRTVLIPTELRRYMPPPNLGASWFML